MSLLKNKLLPVFGVILVIGFFWVLPAVQKYQWADRQKLLFEKHFPKERFRFYEALNNHIDITEPWAWFNPPVHTLRYLDSEHLISFAKKINSYECLIGSDCPAWTTYRVTVIQRDDNGHTNLSDSINIIDCQTGKGGFYHTGKKRFYFWDEDKTYNVQPSKTERDFVCTQPEGKYLKDTDLNKLEKQLSSWESFKKRLE